MGTTSADISDIKRLREETGAGIMEAKRALQEANGDFEKARRLLEQWGMAGAAKRAGRAARQGIVEAYIHAGGQIGVLVELNCETDFVARTDQFKEVAHEIALQVAATDPKYLSVEDIPAHEVDQMKAEFREQAVKQGKPEQIADKIADGQLKKAYQRHVLLEQPYIRDDSKTVRNLVDDLAAQTKENIVLRRFCRFQVGA
jgi:elongation factor Ts